MERRRRGRRSGGDAQGQGRFRLQPRRKMGGSHVITHSPYRGPFTSTEEGQEQRRNSGVTRLEFLLQKEQDAPGTVLVIKEGSDDVTAAMVPQTSHNKWAAETRNGLTSEGGSLIASCRRIRKRVEGCETVMGAPRLGEPRATVIERAEGFKEWSER